MSLLRRFLPAPKRPIKLTSGGWIFILYSIGVGAGAINTGNNLLYLIFGVFLGLIMASGVLSDTNLWRLRGALSLPENAEAGENAYFTLALTNQKKWFPAVSVTAEIVGSLHGQPVKLRVFFPYVHRGATVSREFVFKPPKRGYFEVEKIHVFTRFPFGLLWKRWTILENGGSGQGLFVYPALFKNFSDSFASFSQRLEQDAPVEIWGEGTTAAGIRPFKPGDNPKKINWKATAKRMVWSDWSEQNWLMKEMERDGTKDAFLEWPDWERVQRLTEVELENFIRYVATLIWQLKAHGHRAWLLMFSPSHRAAFSVHSIMEFLSVFEPDFTKEALSRFVEPIHESHAEAAKQKAIDLLERYRAWRKEVMPVA